MIASGVHRFAKRIDGSEAALKAPRGVDELRVRMPGLFRTGHCQGGAAVDTAAAADYAPAPVRTGESEGDPSVATHKSAVKRARQDKKRMERNRRSRSRVKSAVKTARKALETGDPAGAQAAVRGAEGVLRRAASKGAIPKKRASRKVSRLARRQNQL